MPKMPQKLPKFLFFQWLCRCVPSADTDTESLLHKDSCDSVAVQNGSTFSSGPNFGSNAGAKIDYPSDSDYTSLEGPSHHCRIL